MTVNSGETWLRGPAVAVRGAARYRHRWGEYTRWRPSWRAAADPRARLLRKRRWALRPGCSAVASVFWSA